MNISVITRVREREIVRVGVSAREGGGGVCARVRWCMRARRRTCLCQCGNQCVCVPVCGALVASGGWCGVSGEGE